MIQLFQGIENVSLEERMVDLGVIQLKIRLHSSSDDLFTLNIGWHEWRFFLRLVENLQHFLEVIFDDGFAASFRFFILLSLWRGAVMGLKGKNGKWDWLSADGFFLSWFERAFILRFGRGKGHAFGCRDYWLIIIILLKHSKKDHKGYKSDNKKELI